MFDTLPIGPADLLIDEINPWLAEPNAGKREGNPHGSSSAPAERGKRTRKLDPFPGVLSISIFAPWPSAIQRAMDSPKPEPPDSRERFLSAR